MRIRKHAKISPLVYTTSSLNPTAGTQTHVCQLNQSLWDVVTFPPQDPATLPPPPPFLVDNEYYRSYMENRTFVHHIIADESPEEEKWDNMVVAAGGASNEKEDEDRSKLKKDEEEIILCSKTDRKGWQCGERLKNGHSFCEHHLPKGKTYGNVLAHPKKSEENRRRPRPRKPATSSNPYEFYYYSGFGPRWGKKRGGETAAGTAGTTNTLVAKQEPYSSSPESDSTGRSSSTASSPSKNTCIIEDATSNEGPNASDSAPTTPEPNNLKVSVFPEFANEGIDYVEDEDDEDYEYDDDENGEMGKKRARKPIKARSLKSLM